MPSDVVLYVKMFKEQWNCLKSYYSDRNLSIYYLERRLITIELNRNAVPLSAAP